MPDEVPKESPPDAGEEPVPESAPGAREGATTEGLSKEEQLARYEQYLKENDWGHQPC